MCSLYLHIPFCLQRCLYCDFFSHVADTDKRQAYVEQLLKNLQFVQCDAPDSGPLQTLYLGGGTPSLMTLAQVESLLLACGKLFGIAPDCEITLEANPGTVDRDYLQQLRSLGVNRLSLGIQSFDPKQLRRLGRCHSREQGLESITAARAAGFDNISLDLMFALPQQSLEDLKQDIELLLLQQPEHISVYGLTFEEETDFYRRLLQGELVPCPEADYARQYTLLREKLGGAGYEHYELSNFARENRRCLHNQIYWQRRTCLAAGAGAHSFIEKGYGERWSVPADLALYTQEIEAGRNPAQQLEQFDLREAMQEFVYLALRTADGIDLRQFEDRFGHPLPSVFPTALKRISDALLITPQRIVLKPERWLIYDHLISHFF